MEDVDILDVEFEFQHHFKDEYGEFCKTVKTTIRDCIDSFEKELINIGLKNNFITESWIKDKYLYYTESKENYFEIFNQELEKLKIILPDLGIQHLRSLIVNAINSALLKYFPHTISDINNSFFLAQCILIATHDSVAYRKNYSRFSPPPDIRRKNKFAQKGAAAKNKENEAMKADVFKWMDANKQRYKSLNDAAKAIVENEKLVYMKEGTVRKWLTEWNKSKAA